MNINEYNEEDDNSYLNSISDLMSGLLVIFILLFIFITVSYNKDKSKREKLIQDYTTIKTKVIGSINEGFENKGIEIDIDNKTGNIKIDANLLFQNNEYEIKKEGKEYLKKIFPIYVDILFSDEEVRNQILQIIIEGHTDDVGSYLFNMELSQKRAFEVLKFIFSDIDYNFEKKELEKYITANGKSKTELIYTNGKIDRNRSRRVEIKFKLKDEETLKKIKDVLEESDGKI